MVEAFAHGALSMAALIVAIGAQNLFVIDQGIRREHVAVVVSICAASDAALMLIGIVGVGAALSARPDLVNIARYAGILFLLAYAALMMRRAWFAASTAVPTEDHLPLPPSRLGRVVAVCLGLTYLNPHVYLDTVVLLGGMATLYQGDRVWAFWAGGAFASTTWFSMLGYGSRSLAPIMRDQRHRRWFDTAVAALMAAAGVSLVMVTPGLQ
jgi:L-lysine exporter family protein LysE/ArgO